MYFDTKEKLRIVEVKELRKAKTLEKIRTVKVETDFLKSKSKAKKLSDFFKLL